MSQTTKDTQELRELIVSLQTLLYRALQKLRDIENREVSKRFVFAGRNYLPLSGGRLHGNLDIQEQRLQFADTSIKQIDSEYLGVLTRATGAYKSMILNHLKTNGTIHTPFIKPLTTLLKILHDSGEEIWMQSHDGSTIQTVAKYTGGLVNILRGGDITMLADKCLAFTESTSLTIGAGGDITIQGNNTVVDTAGGAASDNLDTLNGGTDGQIVVLHAANDAHTVVCRDGVGNLSLTGGVDFSLDSDCDTITLIFDGAAGLWLELCRADNA